jgi:hypothetical protein
LHEIQAEHGQQISVSFGSLRLPKCKHLEEPLAEREDHLGHRLLPTASLPSVSKEKLVHERSSPTSAHIGPYVLFWASPGQKGGREGAYDKPALGVCVT